MLDLAPPSVRRDAASPTVEVRVLGPVDVVGACRPFARAWTLDLVVYLAMHPRGVASDAWPVALWPERAAAEPTRHSTVSAARRALGTNAAGQDHLPRCSGRLRLEPSVTTDWARFQVLARAEGPDAADSWREALALVRGRPFEGLRSSDWTVLEGVEAVVTDGIAQLAIRLGDSLLARGDGRGAELAVRRGLAACPYDERLYRRLLVAADLQGNPGGVEATMRELLVVVGGGATAGGLRPEVAVDSEALAWVHPETLAAYQALSRRSRLRHLEVRQPATQGPQQARGAGRPVLAGC